MGETADLRNALAELVGTVPPMLAGPDLASETVVELIDGG